MLIGKTHLLVLACITVPSTAWARSTVFSFQVGASIERRGDKTGPARTLATIDNWTCVAGEVTEGVNLKNEANRSAKLTCTYARGGTVAIEAFCATGKADSDHVQATIGEPGRPETVISVDCNTLNRRVEK